jgi:signal transduction histidine kinase
MIQNDPLIQARIAGVVENPLSHEGFNYQPARNALVHEVRNPLTNIKLAVEILRSTTDIEEREMFLDIISRASCKIEDLMNSLLSPHRNEIEPSSKHSIHKLLDEVLALAGDRIFLKNIIIKKEFALQDCELAMNESEMKIALTNIIVNAIEAVRREDGVIKIRTRSNGDKFIIQIEDNGCGISREDLKNIFKPYFTKKPGGLGLGLAATHEILLSNHWTTNVESAVNIGTCFEISLDMTA